MVSLIFIVCDILEVIDVLVVFLIYKKVKALGK